jgi:hypothetical protein
MEAITTIPVPRVPSPPISAPPEARDFKSFVPPPVGFQPKEGPVEELIDKFVRIVPNWASEALWKGITSLSRRVFPQDSAGAPIPQQPNAFRFAVIGDYGSGRKPLTDVAASISARKPNLVVTTGDNVYYNGTEQDFATKWDPPNMFGNIRKNFPVMPTIGNHDIRRAPDAKPYFDRFPELDQARYYSFDMGGVHFVSLNTNESVEPGSPQYRWLAQDLAASQSDWKVLMIHHPMYSGFPKNSGPHAGYLAPLIAKHGVDLVLSGHEHSYSRTKALNDIGTIEVMTGNGGQSLHPYFTRPRGEFAYRDVDFGHVEVEVRSDQLVGRYVTRDGNVRDTFVIPNASPGRATAPSDSGVSKQVGAGGSVPAASADQALAGAAHALAPA